MKNIKDEKELICNLKLKRLVDDLKEAATACIEAQIAAYEEAKKHAHVCIRVLEEIKQQPQGMSEWLNRIIQARIGQTDGIPPDWTDFWSNPEMIVRFFNCINENYQFVEDGS